MGAGPWSLSVMRYDEWAAQHWPATQLSGAEPMLRSAGVVVQGARGRWSAAVPEEAGARADSALK